MHGYDLVVFRRAVALPSLRQARRLSPRSMPTLIAIAVVERDDKFLVGQRPEGVALAGYYEFPGGKVEPGETAERAAVRECWEEAGIAVDVVGEYPPHKQQYEHDCVELRFFACRPSGADKSSRSPFHWVRREALATLDFPAGNRTLLDLLLAR